jgi:hypothetical protein
MLIERQVTLKRHQGVNNANALHLKVILCFHIQYVLYAAFGLLTNAGLRFPCKFAWLLNGTSISKKAAKAQILNTDSTQPMCV